MEEIRDSEMEGMWEDDLERKHKHRDAEELEILRREHIACMVGFDQQCEQERIDEQGDSDESTEKAPKTVQKKPRPM